MVGTGCHINVGGKEKVGRGSDGFGVGPGIGLGLGRRCTCGPGRKGGDEWSKRVEWSGVEVGGLVNP